MRNSLRRRLNIIFIGLAIGPLLLVGIILARRSFTTQGEQALELQHQVAERVSAELDAYLQEVENDINLFFKKPQIPRPGFDSTPQIMLSDS